MINKRLKEEDIWNYMWLASQHNDAQSLMLNQTTKNNNNNNHHSYTKARDSWILEQKKKDAILFLRDDLLSISSSDSLKYWPIDFRSRAQSIMNEDVNDTTDDNNRRVISVKYETLIQLTNMLCAAIEERIYLHYGDNYQNDDDEEEEQPIIAVMIPEGPYLIISIMTIHFLNVMMPFKKAKPILLPIDDFTENSSGQGRLEYILTEDAKPFLVLTTSTCQSNSLAHLLQQESGVMDLCAILPTLYYDYSDMSSDNDLCYYNYELYYINHPCSSPTDSHVISNENTLTNQKPTVLDIYDTESSNKTNWESIKSHLVYTSGSTGAPKGCVSSLSSLIHYLYNKNKTHHISDIKSESSNDNSNDSDVNNHGIVVYLASTISFDPCFSDILATLIYSFSTSSSHQKQTKTTLAISSRMYKMTHLYELLKYMRVTHVLCTPTLWSTVPNCASPYANNIGQRQKQQQQQQQLRDLQVLALGGEAIPKEMLRTWARSRSFSSPSKYNQLKLMATYGVTEACVYQTIGEVFQEDHSSILNVGNAFPGMHIIIAPQQQPSPSSNLLSSEDEDTIIGEVILSGVQIDSQSQYWNKKQLSQQSFVKLDSSARLTFCYKTGDLGFISSQKNSNPGKLHILKRINGEEGMIKVNGIRIELSEIEAAIVGSSLFDDDRNENNFDIISKCVVGYLPQTTQSQRKKEQNHEASIPKQIVAFIVLSKKFISQELQNLRFVSNCHPQEGIVLSPDDNEEELNSLYVLLYHKCKFRLPSPSLIPSKFILIQELPQTSTGKTQRDSKVLSHILSKSLSLSQRQSTNHDEISNGDSLKGTSSNKRSLLLHQYGNSGKIVSEELCSAFNLETCSIKTSSNFFMLGGDSLSAVRICRSLYAKFTGIQDSRYLGGHTGLMDSKTFLRADASADEKKNNEKIAAFHVKYLIQANTLEEYVDFLDSFLISNDGNNDGEKKNNQKEEKIAPISQHDNNKPDLIQQAILESTSRNQTNLTLSLLSLQSKNQSTLPSKKKEEARLGKIKGGKSQHRNIFTTLPIHLACTNGNPTLVEAFLSSSKKNATKPNSSGTFPLHLVCLGRRSNNENTDNISEEEDRIECVNLLLNKGKVSLKSRDAAKQTILHAAARSGYTKLLFYILNLWDQDVSIKTCKSWSLLLQDNSKKKDKQSNTNLQYKNKPISKYDWPDRWFRTPIHWCIMNLHEQSLQMLLAYGLHPCPPLPKQSLIDRTTNGIVESPIQLCKRMMLQSENCDDYHDAEESATITPKNDSSKYEKIQRMYQMLQNSLINRGIITLQH